MVDPQEELVEESLDDSWRTPPGASSFFGLVVWGRSWVPAWGGVGVWVWVWVLFGGLGRGSGVGVAQAVHTRAGGGGALRPLVGIAAALGTGRQCCPTPRCASRECCRGLPRSPSWP